MDLSAPLTIAVLGGLLTLVGYFVSSSLERRRLLNLREMEYRLERYKEFLLSFGEYSANPSYATQLRFVNAVNTILLMGGPLLLRAVKALQDNYVNQGDRHPEILNQIVTEMRRDLRSPGAQELVGFEFPIMVPDFPPADATVEPEDKE